MSKKYCAKCERCHEEGLRDDEDCPYYGEPNGCNHPQYGYNEKKETWRDIVSEMREVSGDETVSEIVITKRDWLTLSDRIDAACKTLEDVLIVEQEENAKLRRALEPVMKCVKLSDISEVFYAVREAQAIMKEGAE